MVTVQQSFSAVTSTFTMVNERWPAVILSDDGDQGPDQATQILKYDPKKGVWVLM